MKNEAAQPIVEVRNLKEYFNINMGMFRTKPLKAVDNVSFAIQPGETLGLVGESGCGKTTTMKTILRVIDKDIIHVPNGTVEFNGKNVLKMNKDELLELRRKGASMISQSPMSALNPVFTIGEQLFDIIKFSGQYPKATKAEMIEVAKQAITSVMLSDPDRIMDSYPHQLSGGMRQRVGIAMGMSYQPKLLLADEPTSALDVTTQAQIVRQMMELRDDYGTSIIVVTHNLGIAAYMSDYIVVMKDGKMEDQGTREYILRETQNAYTRSLLGAVPSVGGERYV